MLEIRWINRQDKVVHRKFFSSIADLLECAHDHEECELYFGVSTRYGTAGKKRDCYRVCCVWADLDNKKISECDFDPAPDLLVDSGTGTHAYWLLSSPLLVRDEERQQHIESINRGLCKLLKADIAAIDTSRILRIPGTLNHKHNPARIVRAYAV